MFQVRFWCRFCKMFTRTLYTPTILHTLHTRPGIDSQMYREQGGNTHSLNVESKRQPYGPHPHKKQRIKVSTLYTTHSSTVNPVRTHTQSTTSKSVLCTRLTPPTSQNKLYHIKFDCVSSPDLVSFLYVVMCPDTQTQNRPRLNHKRL